MNFWGLSKVACDHLQLRRRPALTHQTLSQSVLAMNVHVGCTQKAVRVSLLEKRMEKGLNALCFQISPTLGRLGQALSGQSTAL